MARTPTNRSRNTLGRFRRSSSAIVDITFQPAADAPVDDAQWLGEGIMIIEFQARGTYQYNGVNFVEFTNFKNSPSWGEYFNNFIKDQYMNYERIG